MDISKEIAEIGHLISSAALIMAVRKEVVKCVESGFVVTDGKHRNGGEKYEVIVKTSGAQGEITRRIRSSMPDMDVEKITDGVIGIRASRRSRNG